MTALRLAWQNVEMDPETPRKKDRGWRDDWFATFELTGNWSLLLVPLVIAILAGLLWPVVAWWKGHTAQVVLYCAQDQVFAEPLLAEFTQESGIQVRAVFDSEAVKTVGLANRLLAERAHPQCDVFWGNEELRTRQLAAQNVFRETNGWAAMGYRSRRIVINTNLVRLGPAATPPGRLAPPRSLCDLTNPVWRGKVVLAYPLFGTTATQFLALRQHWGETAWQQWCRALAANHPLLVDGNSIAARLVGRGEAWVGLTDSDDIAAEQREGAPVAALPLSTESLLIPNTVGVVRDAPHPAHAETLFRWLQTSRVLRRLVEAGALEGAAPAEVQAGTLAPDWPRLVGELEAGTAQVKEVFLR